MAARSLASDVLA